MKFDPMTGEPINEDIPVSPPENFPVNTPGDASTVEPRKPLRFDPMTGAPVYEDSSAASPVMMPTANSKKSSGGVKILIGCIAAIALVLVIGVVALSVFFLKPKTGVVAALTYTFEKSEYSSIRDSLMCMEDEQYSFSAKMDLEDDYTTLNVDVSGAVNGPKKIRSLSGECTYNSAYFEFDSSMDDQEIVLNTDLFPDRSFVYNFKEDKSGYLVDIFEREDISIDFFDSILYDYVELSASLPDFKKDYAKASQKFYNSLDFEKIDKKECKINGESRSCKGYEIIVGEDLVNQMCDAYEPVFKKYPILTDLYSASSYSYFGESDTDLILDTIREGARDMEDLSVRFYLYKNQVAEIEIERVNGDLYIFKNLGGEKPLQNFQLIENTDGFEMMLLEKKGSTKNNKVVSTYSIDDGYTLLEITYDEDTKNYELIYSEYDEETFSISGQYESEKSNLLLTVDNVTYYGEDTYCSGELNLEDASKAETVEKADVFDLGNASEDDYMELAEELFSERY